MNGNPIDELFQYAADAKARDKVYRLLKDGFDTATIARHVQRFGVDEAYYLLTTRQPPRRRKSWWKRVFRRRRT